ncbi:FAD-binding oxidoreductase [Knoellia subterranea]|uniref:Delta(24)-sterol reductase n=1 Tax=Knoellia subterranea KCTC 19937 TaxID=1385521 RepID=A0A0A0JRC4_9MICO|nr:FAD-binding oxidoreductase [Knoellia subterranea]KGN38582.1 FAD-linked oxidase [Knoellia subterranea KCTC 19937]
MEQTLPSAIRTEGERRLLDSFAAIPSTERVRLAKRTSNLFRQRQKTSTPGLDTSGLSGVRVVDAGARTADVDGMCTYENLVAATLPHGLAPLVVPQLRTITLGGAVTGLGIESSSFRNGLPHESVIEMDILTGNGEIVTATRDNEHADLFHGFPNSYGSLGYATRLRIELEPVKRYVALRHVRFDGVDALCAAIDAVTTQREHDGEPVDYIDGVVFTRDEAYLTLGRQVDEPPAGGPRSPSDYTGQQIFYRSIQHDGPAPKRDLLTTHDYLWRWDTDWFWCSRAFGAQNPRVRRLWPRRWRRSSVYWKLVAVDHRIGYSDRVEARKGNPPRERVVQDVELPLDRTAEFVEWFLDDVPIEPIWLCPLRLRGETRWGLYPLEPDRMYVNVGFWSTVPGNQHGNEPGATNRAIERKVGQLDGHKSLYSDSFYSREDFDALYGGDEYAPLKAAHDPNGRFPDLYDKAVRNA